MPRNPNKARCSIPECRNWSMRDHTRCRPHRNLELGSQRAGPPPGNLNALQHGRHSNPLAPPDLERLVAAATSRSIAQLPEETEGQHDLAHRVGLSVRVLRDRIGDPFLTLVALRRVLDKLIDRVAARLLHDEIVETVSPLPSPYRERLQDHLIEIAARTTPQEALLGFRRVVRRRLQRKKHDPVENNHRNRG